MKYTFFLLIAVFLFWVPPAQAQLELYEVEANVVRPDIYPVSSLQMVKTFADFEQELTKPDEPEQGYIIQEEERGSVARVGELGAVPEVHFQKINTTRYRVDITNIQNDFVLVLNQRYHSAWKIKENSYHKYDCITPKSYEHFHAVLCPTASELQFFPTLKDFFFLRESPSNHFKINGFSNAWYIQGNQKEVSLLIEFDVQNYFLIGIVIGGITLFGIFLFLSVSWIRVWKNVKVS